MTRHVGLLIAAGAMLLLTFSGAASAQSAQQYPPASGTLAADKTQVRPGETVTITGTQCPANSTVTIFFDNTQVSTVQAGADGSFSATVTVPANASEGSHTISATCVLGNGTTRRQTVTVSVAAAAAQQAGTLPRTGESPVPLALGGATLVALGAGAVIATRRRRSTVS